MKPTIKSHRGFRAAATGVGAALVALASIQTAGAQNITGSVAKANQVTTNGTNAGAGIAATAGHNTAYLPTRRLTLTVMGRPAMFRALFIPTFLNL
jgi:hypothetical protein